MKFKDIEQLGPNQSVLHFDSCIILCSYESCVCKIYKGEEEKIEILEGQPQSRTTARHINSFLTLYSKYTNYLKIPSLKYVESLI